MANDKEDKCWICGKMTINACSACRESGIEISFCSTEHQKLAWPIHKHVCGPGRAKPFLWPPMLPDEVEEMIEHRGKSYLIPAGSGRIKHTSLNEALGNFWGGIKDIKPKLRSASSIIAAFSNLPREIASARADSPTWRSEFLHRALFFFYFDHLLFVLSKEEGREPAAIFSAAQNAYNEVFKLITEDVAAKYPADAAAVMKVWLSCDRRSYRV
ncbi:hypothetical protein JCM6882_000769 [Rhodosporidiobolus microsporus]